MGKRWLFGLTMIFACEAASSELSDQGVVDQGTVDLGSPGDVGVSVDQGADAGVVGCAQPLSQEDLRNLQIGANGAAATNGLGMQPGERLTLQLGIYECCYFFTPREVCATWSISPSQGAAIDPQTGEVTIDASAPIGQVYIARANVESGRATRELPIQVFTPEANPLADTIWSEQTQVLCDGSSRAPKEPIMELAFFPTGRFNVTWLPFEVYVDYWGTYTLDASGALNMMVEGGNYVPMMVDLQGRFELESGTLNLENIWLGAPAGSSQPAACGHVFR